MKHFVTSATCASAWVTRETQTTGTTPSYLVERGKAVGVRILEAVYDEGIATCGAWIASFSTDFCVAYSEWKLVCCGSATTGTDTEKRIRAWWAQADRERYCHRAQKTGSS